ncbi:hypothetical protein GCM10027060_12950 [Nesterenkonia halophila]
MWSESHRWTVDVATLQESGPDYGGGAVTMFGLPMSTTVIMGVVMGFWVVYTLVFYLSTRRWVVEDADYDDATSVDGSDEGGVRR